jgi:hypothetical protein
MELKQVEVFSEVSNYGVVRMPGRTFPGCVIQGDSLSILLTIAENCQALAVATGQQELIEEVQELVEKLSQRLEPYEAVLNRHGMELPYVRTPRVRLPGVADVSRGDSRNDAALLRDTRRDGEADERLGARVRRRQTGMVDTDLRARSIWRIR